MEGNQTPNFVWVRFPNYVIRYLNHSPPWQFTPDNSSLIFKQLAPRSLIHYQAKRAVKYMNQRLLNIIQIILRSFIHYWVSRCGASCLGRIVQGASCLTFRNTTQSSRSNPSERKTVFEWVQQLKSAEHNPMDCARWMNLLEQRLCYNVVEKI